MRFLDEQGLSALWNKIKNIYVKKAEAEQIHNDIKTTYLKKTDAASTYLAKTDAENLYKPKNYTFANSNGGTDGYFGLVSMLIKNPYVDTPIDIYISRRGEDRTRLKLLFMNANHTDPEIGSFAADGPCKDAYMVKTSKSHWILYVKKKNVWDSASIDNFLVNKHMGRWIEFNFIASFSANLPSGAIKAT